MNVNDKPYLMIFLQSRATRVIHTRICKSTHLKQVGFGAAFFFFPLNCGFFFFFNVDNNHIDMLCCCSPSQC